MGKQHTHEIGEWHRTLTWGVQMVHKETAVMTLRSRPGRIEASTEEQRRHLFRVIERWVDRWCERRGYVAASMDIANAREENQPQETVDTVVVAWVCYGPFPEDWMCFAQIAVRLNEPMPGPSFMIPVLESVVEGQFRGPDETPEKVH